MKVVELRQYTVHPGQRDVLIELFDREFVESQEALGMRILGQFRNLDDPDQFVWLRGFDDMTTRPKALGEFYSGPVWKAHAAAANATMVDVDNVLLLRPLSWPAGAARPTVGHTEVPLSRVLATIHYGDRPFVESFVDGLEDRPLASLVTEYAQNNFPALPVRSGVHAFVSLARFPDEASLDAYLAARGVPAGVERLRLAPTARSALR
jgi:hypothetical protein